MSKDQGVDSLVASEVLNAEDERYEAQLNCDLDALEELLAKDLIYFHSSTVIDTKASFIASLESEKLVYEDMERANTKVRIFGNTGIITGRANYQVISRGARRNLDMLFHSVWVKRDGRLEFVSWQSTRVPE